MLQIQKPELEIEEVIIPIPLRKALQYIGITKISTQSIHKLLGTSGVEVLKSLKKNYELFVSQDKSFFNIGGEAVETILPAELHFMEKGNLIRSAILFHLGIPTSLEGLGENSPDELEAVGPITGGSMAHKKINEELTGMTSVPFLKDATEFYEPVKSTTPESRYVFIAREKTGSGKLAMRLRGTKCSVRIEPYSDSIAGDILMLGLSNNGDYASGHFDMSSDLALKRYMAMLSASLVNWEVAKFDEEKIRKLGV